MANSRMKSLKIAAGLAGAMSLFVAAGTVSYYEESLPTTMNPLFARAMVDHRTHELIFDRLFYRSPVTNKLKSRLVSRYEVIEGGAKVKLWIVDGIQWHDGEELTADDICFTVDTMLDDRTASTMGKEYRESISSCESDAKEGTVTISFRKLFYEPRERIAFPVLPKHMFDGTNVTPDTDFSSRPVGTGPMKGSRGRDQVRFEAKKNAHHNARIDVLQMQQGGDPLIQIRTLVNKGVQGLVSVAPQYRPDVKASDDLALKSYDLRSWWFIAVNTNKGPLKEMNIRQALNYTLDRWELRELTVGYDPEDATPPCEFTSGPFVKFSPYYNHRVPVYERSDKGQATQLMEAAGAVMQNGKWLYDDKIITLKIGINTPLESEAKDMLSQVGNQLQAGGFDRYVEKVSADKWNQTVVTGNTDEWDMLIGKWSFGLVEDVNQLFQTRNNQTGEGALNIFNYSNEDVDILLNKYSTAQTDTEARDAYHDLHEYLSEDLPYLFLWKLDTKSAWRNEVRNNTPSPYYYFTSFDGWKFEG